MPTRQGGSLFDRFGWRPTDIDRDRRFVLIDEVPLLGRRELDPRGAAVANCERVEEGEIIGQEPARVAHSGGVADQVVVRARSRNCALASCHHSHAASACMASRCSAKCFEGFLIAIAGQNLALRRQSFDFSQPGAISGDQWVVKVRDSGCRVRHGAGQAQGRNDAA
jgi:hypothetical protein